MDLARRLLFCWLMAAFAVFGGSAARAAQPAAGPGPEVCKNCHSAYVETYEASKHGQKGNRAGPANAGACAACHGDTGAHVRAGGGRGTPGLLNPGPRSKSMSAEAKSKLCMNCHESNRHLAFWDSGKHKKNEVSCTDCHNSHGESPASLRADRVSVTPYLTTNRQLQYETCASCHKDIMAQVRKPSHHPVIEGKVKCSDCHNPHGALSKGSINSETTNTLCFSCHADKRGPFINEHPPVEQDCLSCHNVHGSQHNKLLSQKVPNLCQDCHNWTRHPATPYGAQRGFGGVTAAGTSGTIATQFVARGCLNCHNQIHGSNGGAAGRGEFFAR